jgi:hypothetical protein
VTETCYVRLSCLGRYISLITLCYWLYFSCLFYFRNLQGAVCSYFDFESPHKLPSMSLVKDVTIGEGESIPPCTK